MWLEGLGVAGASAGLVAWGVRGRSATWIAPSVWRGPRERRALALTFDDGPSESTPRLLEDLARFRARATFFQCGHHARRLPAVAREVAAAGHEIGNHTDTHPALYFRSPAFIEAEIARAQEAIEKATGHLPRLFRAPFGARWFGLAGAQRRHGLMGVMWTLIARDWKLPAPAVATRLLAGASPGSVLCLHDGRLLVHRPDVESTLGAVRRLLPVWVDRGYELITVSELFGFTNPGAPSDPSAGRARQ